MRHSDEQPSKDDVPDPHVDLSLRLNSQQFTGRGGNVQDQVAAFTGMNYVAIHTKSLIAASSEAVIFDKRVEPDDESEELHGRADKSFRWWDLLSDASPWQTNSQLLMERIQQLGIHGMSMVWNVKNGWGKTSWRISVPLALVSPINPGYRDHMPYGGIRVTTIQTVGQYFNHPINHLSRRDGLYEREISITDISLAAFPHPVLRGDGYSPTTATSSWSDIIAMSERAESEQYERGSSKRVLIPYPEGENPSPTTADLDAMQRKYERRFRDTESNVVIVPPGTTGQEVTIDPDSMRYTETSELYGRNMLAAHGVSPAVAGMGDNHTYGAIAAAMQGFTANSLQPTLDLLAAEDTAAMRKEEGKALYIKYIAPKVADPELEQRDKELDLQRAAIAKDLPFTRVDQVLSMLGLPKLGGKEGEMFMDDVQAGTPDKPQSTGPVPGELTTKQSTGDKIAANQLRDATKLAALPSVTKSMRRGSMMAETQPGQRAPVIAFDLDGTLAKPGMAYTPGIINEPNEKMIQLTRVLKNAGCNIVVYTARDEDETVAEWLDSSGVPWCGINENPYVGPTGSKMLYDVLIDDRATTARTNEGVVMQSIIEHLHADWADKVLDELDRSTADNQNGYLFAPIGGKLAEKIRSIQKMIKTDHLDGDGIVSDLHITILSDMVGGHEPNIAKLLSPMKAAEFRLFNRLSLFDPKEPGGPIPLVVELEGGDIPGIHSVASRQFSHIQRHVTYRPHITLAYVMPGEAGRYADKKITRTASVIDQLVYRHPDDADLIINLRD
ncbi:MAG: phage portal protein [Planctomycetota bacterium]